MLQWHKDADNHFYIDFNLNSLEVTIMVGQGFLDRLYQPVSVPHLHHRHEIFFVCAGECVLHTVGNDYCLPTGSFTLIPAEMNHYVTRTTSATELHFLKLQYRITDIPPESATEKKLLRQLEYVFSRHDQVYIFQDESSVIASVDQILDDFSQKQPFYQQKFVFDIMTLLIRILRTVEYSSIAETAAALPRPDTSETGEAPAKQRNLNGHYEVLDNTVDGFFNNHYSQDITLNDLSMHLHLSISHTKRLLKQMYGIGFSEMLARKRIQIAIIKMMTGQYTWESIAEEVGYESYNGFLYAFKHITGQKPSEYKNHNILNEYND